MREAPSGAEIKNAWSLTSAPSAYICAVTTQPPELPRRGGAGGGCENGDEPSGSVKFPEFIYHLSDYQLLTKDSARRDWFVGGRRDWPV